jgi:transposase InsO family protein
MKDLLALLAHLLTTVAKLLGPGGTRAVLADSLLMKQQLLVLNRSRRRAPNLSAFDRLLFGFWSLFLTPRRIRRSAIIIKPSTLLRFHEILKRRKYRLLYSSGNRGKPGPKGPTRELILAIVEMKRRNPRYGCPKIAEQITKLFGIDIDKDVVRRILAKHYHPSPDTDGGPSWLTFIGNMKDSLWSVDLFRCESILLKTHWVLAVMDQFSRRIVGFGVHAGDVDGVALCRMFNSAISTMGTPTYLSTDNDPLFDYQRWQANLRILEIDEIKAIPYTPISHPFIERLIGTIRRDYLDHTLFWNAIDLERKLADFQSYYNQHRTHNSLGGATPAEMTESNSKLRIKLNNFRWQSHCHGLYQLPIAA